MPSMSPHEEELENMTKRFEREKYLTVQANTHIGTCSNCRRPVNVQAWDDHVCINQDAPDMGQSLGDILEEALAKQAADDLNQLREAQIRDSVTDHLTSKLYECVASHYENGDRNGAEAIINAIQFALQ